MRIEIVEDIREKLRMDNRYVHDVINGKVRVDRNRAEKTIIITPEVFAKVFSPQRIKLILRIKKNNISNIYQLAKGVNRKYEAVYRDIKLLEGFGIVKLRKKDNQRVPFMDESVRMPEFAAG